MSDSTKRRRLLEEINEIDIINNVNYVCTKKLHDPLERNINVDNPPIGQYNSSYIDPKNTVFDGIPSSDIVNEKCSTSDCKYTSMCKKVFLLTIYFFHYY